ncbi:DEAD-box family (RNA) helicase, putative [Theileria annulata]|uniref:ATP-dependent RNA helicase n=1 Tax=Theileria annulata TaxID=5874 RepID=Q4UIB5_THEAN|nr:DEAD-box family (RNA) helicase, putative [Theileria annulata]CAI73174.1 DEAD-box family (RNA) helicase, putative [Theileria annulata]|eukprot:XP_953852.1 DEAD-box family (RNA) helicase, putative [Theileria annulata]
MLFYIITVIYGSISVYSYIISDSRIKYGNIPNYTRLESDEIIQNLNPTILSNLEKIGIQSLNQLQYECIPKILDDYIKNVCILSQTGTGKTLSYLVPIVQMILNSEEESTCVVIVPNSILMYQVYDVLNNLTSGLNIKVKTVDDVEKGKVPNIVISSPLKLLNKFKTYSLNYNFDAFKTVKYLVLDEVDQLFVHKQIIIEILKRTKNRCKTILSSSTLPDYGTKSDSNTVSKLFKNCSYIKSQDLHKIPSKVSLEFINYKDEDDRGMLILYRFNKVVEYLYSNNDRMIIYCNSSVNCEKLYNKLSNLGKNVHILNKNIDLMEQLLILTSLDKKMIILSTDHSSRGVDFKNIKTVIHYDFPTNVVNFIHRTGRVGRHGNEGNCLAFWSESDEFLKNHIENNLNSFVDCFIIFFRLSKVFSRKRGLRKKFKKAQKLLEPTLSQEISSESQEYSTESV